MLEEGEGVTPIDEIESIQPGETKRLRVDLAEGHYALICNLTGHFRMDMRAGFNAGDRLKGRSGERGSGSRCMPEPLSRVLTGPGDLWEPRGG